MYVWSERTTDHDESSTAVDTETFIHSSRMLNRNLRDFKVLLTVDSSLQY